MTLEQIRQRSELLGTQVITRDGARRLGVVSQLWVDIDRREVVAIGMRDNLLAVAGLPKYMFLKNVKEIGDVVLVEDERVLEDDIEVEAYSNLINSEVITETGEPLGRVRGFRFDTETGQLVSLIIASIGIPQIPDQFISTYELGIEEIVSSGPNRLIVFEGSEERLQQLTVGVIERLGLGEAPWQREQDGIYYPPTVKPENQLGPGQPVAPERRTVVSAPQEIWDEDYETAPPPRPVVEAKPVYEEYYEEPLPPPAPRARVQRQPLYEDDYYEEDNWSESEKYDYEEERYAPPERRPAPAYDDYEYEEQLENDAWADDEAPKPYQAPRVNIPQKRKMPEYEEEAGY
jgi:sporulation protein YlmC with PRC-barrel domain